MNRAVLVLGMVLKTKTVIMRISVELCHCEARCSLKYFLLLECVMKNMNIAFDPQGDILVVGALSWL